MKEKKKLIKLRDKLLIEKKKMEENICNVLTNENEEIIYDDIEYKLICAKLKKIGHIQLNYL